MKNWRERIVVGVTTTANRRPQEHWKEQLREIKALGIKKIALFPTTLLFKERKELYQELEKSGVEEVKLLHLRDDFKTEELEYFWKRFKTRWFNCHEHELKIFYDKFPKFRKNILLELTPWPDLAVKIEPNRLGGFCLDLAHVQMLQEREHRKKVDYIISRLKNTPVHANHLNGYSFEFKKDQHFVSRKEQLNYLTKLPEKMFGEVLALEMENSIKSQLKYKEYIVKLFSRRFGA